MGGVVSRAARQRGSSLTVRERVPNNSLESARTGNAEYGGQTPSVATNNVDDCEKPIEPQRIGSTNPDLPEGAMLHELFGMITSKTKKFVEEEEIYRHVPSKETNLARKSHRIETKDLRIVMQKISRESRSLDDLQRIALEYGLMNETVVNMANHCRLPRVSKLQDGRLIDQSIKRR